MIHSALAYKAKNVTAAKWLVHLSLMKVHDIFSSCSIVSDSPDNDIYAIHEHNAIVNLYLHSANQACQNVIFDNNQQHQR